MGAMRGLSPVLALAAAAALAATTCGSDPNVGATCTATAGCDKGLTCDTAVPNGYCTKACTTVASKDECPDGSICDSLSSSAGLSCVKICSEHTDCRGDLECNGVSSTNVKACKLKASGTTTTPPKK